MKKQNETMITGNTKKSRLVTVYAASSDDLAAHYIAAAAAAGQALADGGCNIIYGGGSTGLMGAMADAALDRGAEVHGVTPQFLKDLEVSHKGLTSLRVVNDMRERKHLMLEQSHAVVTLPGGCGTYEELFEALTLKRLARWTGPIVLLNTGGFYNGLNQFLRYAVSENFMTEKHADMWTMVDHPQQLMTALDQAPAWSEDALSFATICKAGQA